MHQAKFNSILRLSAQERYSYLIRRATDYEEVYLIRNDAELIELTDSSSQVLIPIFPEKEFAEHLLVDDWQDCFVERIKLDALYLLLDRWQEQPIKVAGFPRADLNAIVVTAEEIKNHLLHESQQYE